MRRPMTFFAAALLSSAAIPAIAAADTAQVTTDLNMRAGPSTSFPVVRTLPDGATVDIYGCVGGYSWCDVSWSGSRGWVYADYLTSSYEGRVVPIVEYGSEIDLPILTFSIGSYWDDYYRNEPWYHRRSHWRSVWDRHDHDRGHRRREGRAEHRDRDHGDQHRADRRRERRDDVRERRAEHRERVRERRTERRERVRERRAERRQNVRERRAEHRQRIRNRRAEHREHNRSERRSFRVERGNRGHEARGNFRNRGDHRGGGSRREAGARFERHGG